MKGYLYIILTLVFTIYGQLILKWRINSFGPFPDAKKDQLIYIGKSLLDPYVISSFAAAFIASLTWIAALTKFDLSYAYPFMSLSFIFVLFLSYLLFNEPFTLNKIIGVAFVVAGLYFASK
jgi:drug/metabolite transporter (DMT)-like permease